MPVCRGTKRSMGDFVKIAENERDDAVEVPVEKNGTLLVSNVAAQFPGACGLRYRPLDAQSYRGVRLVDGVLHPPGDGWKSCVFFVNYPRGWPLIADLRSQEKRKLEESDVVTATKLLCTEPRISDLVVLGLPFSTNEEELKDYFGAFGTVVLSQVKNDPVTGKSKGFGFVRFADYESQLKALSMRHMIGGRWCDVKLPQSKMYPQDPEQNRVFVGRCPEDFTAEDLREYFCQFGEVTDVYIPKPFRSFGFITFANESVAQSLCGQDVIIKGSSVHLATAEPKNAAMRRQSRLATTQNTLAGLGAALGIGMNAAATPTSAGGFNFTPAMVAAMTQALQTGNWGNVGMGGGQRQGPEASPPNAYGRPPGNWRGRSRTNAWRYKQRLIPSLVRTSTGPTGCSTGNSLSPPLPSWRWRSTTGKDSGAVGTTSVPAMRCAHGVYKFGQRGRWFVAGSGWEWSRPQGLENHLFREASVVKCGTRSMMVFSPSASNGVA
uniref:TAR DNA-binding protein 43-like isoform X3 n=1 Tax=Myxine glutinosa TaxID=7769 RepID=UPI00358EC015